MVLPAVMCQTDIEANDDEIDDPSAVFDIMCKPGEQSNAWYKCMSCCQGLLPYVTAGNKNPYDETRSLLYGFKSLSSATMRSMCDNPTSFTDRLKNVELDLKRELKPCCLGDDGMQEFYANRTKCFFKCDKNPEDLSYCQSVSEMSVQHRQEALPVIPVFYGIVRGEHCRTAKDDQGCCMFRPSVNPTLEKVCPSSAPASYVCKSDVDTCLDIDPYPYKGYSYRTFCPDRVTSLEGSLTKVKPARQIYDPENAYLYDKYGCTWERELVGSKQQIAAEAAFTDWCASRNGKLFGVDNPFCECRNFGTHVNNVQSKLDKFQRECGNFKGTWSNDSISP
ncbi:hypothetical protein EC991_005080 [Linnemannia zychae]|nr:hypothetical protein EC991_005080 [Linnemannia zychae]